MPERPHLVIFNPDQWRGDVMGHLGNPAAVTPNLDRVAAQSERLVFTGVTTAETTPHQVRIDGGEAFSAA